MSEAEIGFELEDHPKDPRFWRHIPSREFPCWVCQEPTEWVFMDLGYQHLDCAMYPTEDGIYKKIRGVEQTTAPAAEVKGTESSARISKKKSDHAPKEK